MGLDIIVGKVRVVHETVVDDDRHLLLEHNPGISIFEDRLIKISNEYFDLEKSAKEIGYNYKEDEWIGSDSTPDDLIQFRYRDSNNVTYYLVDPPTFKKEEIGIFYDEIGYQRRGENGSFHKEGIWNSDAIVDKETLLKHKDRYFSGEIYNPYESVSRESWGQYMKLNINGNDQRKNFQTQIVDKFVEGETFVLYC